MRIYKNMDAVELFKSLGEPIRLRILHLLANAEPELCVCDLVAVLGSPQGTISRHLTHLRLVGLVSDRREGVWVHYKLSPAKSKAHSAMIKCLKGCFADDAMLAKDVKEYLRLKAGKSLACCVPQNPQGRRTAPQSKPRRSR
jgi:ArsR family transcriptional regulator